MITYHERVMTGDDGEFRMRLNVEGKTVLRAQLDGREPVELALEPLRDNEQEIVLRAGPKEEAQRLVLFHGGKPVARGRFVVAEVGGAVGQRILGSERSSGDGLLRIRGMCVGRRYFLSGRWRADGENRSIQGYFTWDGNERIDLDAQLDEDI